VNKSFLNRLGTNYKFHSAGSSKKMADHRLCGVNFYLFGGLTKGCFDGSCLKKIVVMGSGSMSIDIIYFLW
jgi:hypothetical protein